MRPKLNYRSTVPFSESILNTLDMHILFFRIIYLEKPQLIYMALSFMNNFIHSPSMYWAACRLCAKHWAWICKQDRHRTSSLFSGNIVQWGCQTGTWLITTECEQCWKEPSPRYCGASTSNTGGCAGKTLESFPSPPIHYICGGLST